jgi:hypothetical protein
MQSDLCIKQFRFKHEIGGSFNDFKVDKLDKESTQVKWKV